MCVHVFCYFAYLLNYCGRSSRCMTCPMYVHIWPSPSQTLCAFCQTLSESVRHTLTRRRIRKTSETSFWEKERAVVCCRQVWFEVSAHTSRLHFHAAKDGSEPFGLSLPMGTLQGAGVSASLQDLLQALDTR